MLEKEIEKYLVKRVKDLGGVAYKFVSPANRGVCDRIVVLPKRVIFVEVKQPKGKLTELQKHFGEVIRGYELEYACVWSKGDVDACFSRM